MRYILITLECVAALLLTASCNKWNETVVKSAGDRECREYFTVYGTDTSANSFVILKFDDGKSIMKMGTCRFSKLYTGESLQEMHDTTCVSDIPYNMTKRYHLTTYQGIMKELSLCLEEASKEIDIHGMSLIDFALSRTGDLMATVSRQVISKTRKDDWHAGFVELGKALEASSLRSDINKIFSKYQMEVEGVHAEEVMEISRKEMTEENIFADSTLIPPYGLGAWVTVSLRPMSASPPTK